MKNEILNSLRPYKSKIQGFDLAQYIQHILPSTKKEYDYIGAILEKAKTDVVTDGKRVFTIGKSGGPNSHYEYKVYLLKLQS